MKLLLIILMFSCFLFDSEVLAYEGARGPVGHWTRDGCRRILLQSWLTGGPPPWADLRWNCFSWHDADVALWLALYALSYSGSRHAICAACGSSDG
ncbi:hypothetical protein LAZ67_8003422 [Cordylochernes scorpioides]|uniref:Secreted protein n=1 Tax=Cordylochernes scorpioides TaxID=51811 RepID=A0ABY6KRI2_9ARAC|nr:hypothetical protein LAZ67_8003422 [Cordylochernes scorpioides]